MSFIHKSLQNFFPILATLLFITSAFSDEAHDLIIEGDTLYSQEQDKASLEIYERAFSLNSTKDDTAWKLARAYVDVGKTLPDKKSRESYFRKGVEYARKAINLNPKNSNAHLYLCISLGKLALEAGPKEQIRISKEIKLEAEITIELNPKDHLAWHILGSWHQKLATLNWFEKKMADIFLGGVPKDASLEKSVECFRKAIALEPKDIFHHLELGITYEELKGKDLAIAEYQKVIDLPIHDSEDPAHQKEAKRRLNRLLTARSTDNQIYQM